MQSYVYSGTLNINHTIYTLSLPQGSLDSLLLWTGRGAWESGLDLPISVHNNIKGVSEPLNLSFQVQIFEFYFHHQPKFMHSSNQSYKHIISIREDGYRPFGWAEEDGLSEQGKFHIILSGLFVISISPDPMPTALSTPTVFLLPYVWVSNDLQVDINPNEAKIYQSNRCLIWRGVGIHFSRRCFSTSTDPHLGYQSL